MKVTVSRTVEEEPPKTITVVSRTPWEAYLSPDDRVALGKALAYALAMLKHAPDKEPHRSDAATMKRLLDEVGLPYVWPNFSQAELDKMVAEVEEDAIWNWAGKLKA